MISENLYIVWISVFVTIIFIFSPVKIFAADINATIKISVCGNSVLEGGEQCDNSDMGGRTCSYLGYSGGTLNCTLSCAFDTSSCSTGAEKTAISIFSPSVNNSYTLFNGDRSITVDLLANSHSDILRLHMFSYLPGTISNIKPAPSSNKEFLGKVYDLNFFDSSGYAVSTLSKPVTIIITYTSADINGIDESTIKPYKFEDGGSAWELISGSVLNTESKTVTFTTSSFSWFALLGSPPQSGGSSSGFGSSSMGGRRHLSFSPPNKEENKLMADIKNTYTNLSFNTSQNKDIKDEKDIKQDGQFTYSKNSMASLKTPKTNASATSDNYADVGKNQGSLKDNLKIISLLLILISIIIRLL